VKLSGVGVLESVPPTVRVYVPAVVGVPLTAPVLEMLSPGGSDERVALYVGEVTAPPADADGLAGTAGLAEENEDIRIRVWPAARAMADALDGKFPNVVTTLALLWLAARHADIRRAWSAP